MQKLAADHPHLRELAAYARQLTGRLQPVDPPLANFVAVGSLYDVFGQSGIYDRDVNWIRRTFDACRSLKFGIAPDLTLQQPDIGTNGVDFVAPNSTIKGDVVIACYIPTNDIVDTAREFGITKLPLLGNALVSSPHRGRNVWRDAVKRAEARMVVTFSSPKSSEIDASHFESKDFILWTTDQVMGPTVVGPVPYDRSVLLRRDLYQQARARL